MWTSKEIEEKMEEAKRIAENTRENVAKYGWIWGYAKFMESRTPEEKMAVVYGMHEANVIPDYFATALSIIALKK